LDVVFYSVEGVLQVARNVWWNKEVLDYSCSLLHALRLGGGEVGAPLFMRLYCIMMSSNFCYICIIHCKDRLNA
jgi:hypothetical protein